MNGYENIDSNIFFFKIKESKITRGHNQRGRDGLAGARWPSELERCTGDRMVLGSNPAAATSLRNFGNSVTPLCQRLSEETIKAVGPFYPVSMPGEVKYPTSMHWKCVTCRGLHQSIVDSTTLMDHTGNKSLSCVILLA